MIITPFISPDAITPNQQDVRYYYKCEDNMFNYFDGIYHDYFYDNYNFDDLTEDTDDYFY
jgi:hypothetical protein